VRSCPVCGGSRREVLHQQHFAVFDGYPLPDRYDVAACSECGMVFADTAATQEDYNRYYSEWSIYAERAVVSEFERERQRGAALRACREILTGARILDIGCGNGLLLELLREAGHSNLTGLDPSAACVTAVRAKGIAAHQGWFSALPGELASYDLVILNSVLEHVLDVRTAVHAATSLLAPAGRLFTTVPDAERYSEFLYTPFEDFNTEHINHFSPESLDTLLRQFGMRRVTLDRLTVRGPVGLPIPRFEAVYERGDTPDAPICDLRPAMRHYIELSGGLMQRLNTQIKRSLIRSRDLIAWGTGQLAMKLARTTALADAGIVMWVDGNPVHHGRTLCGAPVVAPERIVAPPDVPVLITTLLHTAAIETRIRSLGWNNEIIQLSQGSK